MINCPHCDKKLDLNVYDCESFKNKFKVGDTIKAFPTRVWFKITAIGERRFLAKDSKDKERVLTMATPNRYEKVEDKND